MTVFTAHQARHKTAKRKKRNLTPLIVNYRFRIVTL